VYRNVPVHWRTRKEDIGCILNKRIVIIRRKYSIHATDVYQVKRNQRIWNAHAGRPTEKSFVYVVAPVMTVGGGGGDWGLSVESSIH
jgi:hypothetical protein